jgi:hypothetical protein
MPPRVVQARMLDTLKGSEGPSHQVPFVPLSGFREAGDSAVFTDRSGHATNSLISKYFIIYTIQLLRAAATSARYR